MYVARERLREFGIGGFVLSFVFYEVKEVVLEGESEEKAFRLLGGTGRIRGKAIIVVVVKEGISFLAVVGKMFYCIRF